MIVTFNTFLTASLFLFNGANSFGPLNVVRSSEFRESDTLLQSKGFGGGGKSASTQGSRKKKAKGTRLVDTLADKPKSTASANKPFVRSEQDDLLEQLANQAASTCIGRAVASAPVPEEGIDPFWELMPSLISSRFSHVPDQQLERVAGMIRHTLDPNLPLEDSIISEPFRPHDEIHAYMPGLGETKPFYDPNEVKLCQLLSDNYETIKGEYHALISDKKDRFQSVTSMNYDSGWRTLVLFYNGHRIPDFPYHLCPTTTKILETVPLAGRVSRKRKLLCFVLFTRIGVAYSHVIFFASPAADCWIQSAAATIWYSAT